MKRKLCISDGHTTSVTKISTTTARIKEGRSKDQRDVEKGYIDTASCVQVINVASLERFWPTNFFGLIFSFSFLINF